MDGVREVAGAVSRASVDDVRKEQCPNCHHDFLLRIPKPIDMELQMLREFYRSWVAFHKIPRDSLHRKKQETASQLMVDNAHAVAAYYKSYEHADG